MEVGRGQGPSEVAGALLGHGFLGEDASGLAIASRCGPDELRFLAVVGYLGPVLAGRTVRLDVDHGPPSARAVLTGRPVVLPDRSAVTRLHPEFARMAPDVAAAIALPAVHAGRVIGALGVIYAAPQDFAADTLDALTLVASAVADVCLAGLVV